MAALLVIAVGGVLALRTHRQHETAKAIALDIPNSVDESMYVKIGGIDQWIQIRGQDNNNPVLLCLNGGPGATWTPLTQLFAPWEKDFTVVQWDQRGAGKTLESTGASVAASMSIDRMALDGIEVSEFLSRHLHKEKIILLGHSWGSILGVHIVKQRPDLFYAYVGTGQAADMKKSIQAAQAYTLEKARAAGNRDAVKELESVGPPPYRSKEQAAVFFKWNGEYEVESDRAALMNTGRLIFGAPNYSLWDMYNRYRGFMQIPTWRLYQEMLTTDLASLGIDFKVPVYFFQGAEDELTVTAITRQYFEAIDAPHKEMVLFEGAGHFAVWSMPDKFLQELDARVRPLATRR
ncbi:MAG TPA: alpha/beta hydrolase [Bryobacteraceae bacterium]|nr:alpha/beta hydrolase [Bryobacteraceae bacterium]